MAKIIKNNWQPQLQLLAKSLGSVAPKIIFKAEAIALKLAGVSMRARAVKRGKQEISLRATPSGKAITVPDFKKRYTNIKTKLPRRGRGFTRVRISGRGIYAAMYKFTPTRPAKQAGRTKTKKGKNKGTFSKRTVVRVKAYKKGKGTMYKTAFVFLDGSGRYQLGQRKKPVNKGTRPDGQKTELHVKTLSAPGPGHLMANLKMKKPLEKYGAVRFELVFRRKFKFFAEKEIKRRLRQNIRRL